jgi:hypothetical protein
MTQKGRNIARFEVLEPVVLNWFQVPIRHFAPQLIEVPYISGLSQ